MAASAAGGGASLLLTALLTAATVPAGATGDLGKYAVPVHQACDADPLAADCHFAFEIYLLKL